MEIRTDKLRFFRTQAELRRWFEKKHASEQELWIGFYRKDSGKGGITYPEALDEALCFGWIDGIRKKLDEVSYTTRFTPRKARSIWSNVNVKHVARLTAAGRMAEPGIAAFKLLDPSRAGVYSFEQQTELTPPMRKELEKNARARKFFDEQPHRYRRAASWWVISAKKDETRERRLAELISRSAAGLRIAQFIPVDKRTKPG